MVEADTTATSETYALPNGNLLTRVYLYPVNGRDAEGKWQPLSEAAYARDAASTDSAGQSDATGKLSPDAERPLGQEDETSCSITSSAPTASACNEKTFKVGYESSGEVRRRGLIFFVLPDLHEEEIIMNAQVELYAGSTTTTNAGAMGVYRATKPWTSAATWDDAAAGTAWATPGGDFAEGATNEWINSSVGATKGWEYWYPTQLVREWYAGSDASAGEYEPDLGFLVKDASEGSTNNVVSFDGREEREHDPQLSIESRQRGIGDNSRYTMLTTPISSSQSLSVNPASGDLMIHSTDFSIPDDGFEFVSARNWNSLDEEAPGYGYGWVDTNAVYIEPFKGSGAVAYIDGTDATFPFIKEGANFITPPGIEATMCAAGSASPCPASLPSGVTYQLIYTKTGERINFKGKEPEDFPIDVENAAGQTITAGYGSEIEEPISWTDAEGTKIAYTATYEKGYTKITNKSTGRSATYTETKGADVIDHLTKYTSMSDEATSYAYGKEYLEGNQLQQITEPGGEVIKLAYGEHERIAKIERFSNAEATKATSTTTYTYYALGKAPAPCKATQKATVIAVSEGEAQLPVLYCANALDEVEPAATPPSEPHEISALLEEDSETEVSWDPSADPTEIDGYRMGDPGTVVAYEYRYQLGAGAWTDWSSTSFDEFMLPATKTGEQLKVEVEAEDNAGNVSPTASVTTTIAEPDLTPESYGETSPYEESSSANIEAEREVRDTEEEAEEYEESGDALVQPAPAAEPSPQVTSSYKEKLCGSEPSPCGKYNAKAAAQYAHTWFSKENYRYFDFFPSGGDCTNFASQALHAGGMQYMRAHGDDNPEGNAPYEGYKFPEEIYLEGKGSWWSYVETERNGIPFSPDYHWSDHFTVAHELYLHLMSYKLARQLPGHSAFKVGDLVFFNLFGTALGKSIDHTEIVTKVTKTAVWVAQHTTDFEHTFAEVLEEEAKKGRYPKDNMEYVIVEPTHTAANIE